MDLTILIDINPNPGPHNCLRTLYLNARSLKAFVQSNTDPSIKVCKISMLQNLVITGMYDLICIEFDLICIGWGTTLYS